jgi:hypothetical protein
MLGNERGNIALFVVIAVAVIVLGFVACDALFDDEDEKDDLGWVPVTVLDNDYERDGDEKAGSSDCRDARAACEDNDFSPEFDRSPVEDSFNPQICVMPGSCTTPPPEGETDV